MPDAGVTSSKSATSRFNGSLSIWTLITPGPILRATPGSDKEKCDQKERICNHKRSIFKRLIQLARIVGVTGLCQRAWYCFFCWPGAAVQVTAKRRHKKRL